MLKSFALRTTARGPQGAPSALVMAAADVPAARGRADSGDLELDLVELFTDVADLARDLGVGIGSFIDEMQDVSTAELAALCGACHEISQQGAPLVVVGAGLPHLPVALAASKSYAERLFRYVVVDRLPREMADRGAAGPGRHRGRRLRARRARRALPARPTATPTSCRPTARSPGTAPLASPIRCPTYGEAAPEAERASWRSASSAPATTGPPRPSATTCARWPSSGADNDDGSVTTADIARTLAASRRACPRPATG